MIENFLHSVALQPSKVFMANERTFAMPLGIEGGHLEAATRVLEP